MKETSISLSDLVRRILLRWKAVILWMVIFAVLMDGVYYVRATRSSAQTVQESADPAGTYLARIAELQKPLTDREIAEVQLAVDAYSELMERYQEGDYADLDDLRLAWYSLYGVMTEDQLAYYDALLDGTYEGLADGSVESTPTDVARVQPRVISVRYVGLGLLIGLLFAIIVIAIADVFGRKLRVKEDLVEVYDIPLLGCLDGTPRKLLSGPVCRGINRAFFRRDAKYSEEERLRMIAAGIRLAVEKGEMRIVYLTGTAGDPESEQRMAAIAEQLQGGAAQVAYGKSVVYDPESLEALTAADGAVFVERVDGSTYEDIAKEVAACERYEVPIIGGIVIR